MWRVYPEPYVTCRFPSFQPRWIQGLIDTGSRCNQFFLSHQRCFQGAATWLKVKAVSGGSTSHELWHWKLTKLTPKPSLKLTASSKFVPENRPFFAPKGSPDRIVSQPRISGANLYSVRVRWNFAIINFETMFHAVHAQNLYICFVEFSNAIKVWLRRARMQWFRLFKGVMLNCSSLEPDLQSKSTEGLWILC